MKNLRKPKLSLEDEAKIYFSSKISINVHEEYQLDFGGECNERTFKIPASGGFQIVDDVAVISKYFKKGEEILVASNNDEWRDMVQHFLQHEDERQMIARAGRERVLSEHTYDHRVRLIESLIN